MYSDRFRIIVLVAVICGFTAGAYAVDPNPLENAYWRFEEGTPTARVAATTPEDLGAVIDSINANNMRRFGEPNAPMYVDDVPAAVVPATSAQNKLSLLFSGSFQDVYTDGKKINNPIVDAFTLEASFKSQNVGAGLWQAIVSKESKNDDLSSDSPPFELKITGDGNNRLRLEMRDKGNTLRVIDSISPIVVNTWYHAAVIATNTQVSLYLAENNNAGYVFQGSAPISGGGPLWQGTVPKDGYNTVWNIGKGMWARAITDFFIGMIDEVRLSNRALDLTELLWFPVWAPGDFNKDGKVDIEDFVLLQSCATGPAIPYDPQNLPEGCTLTPDDQGIIAADFRGDGDVDQVDFAIFQRCYGDAGNPADPACAD